MTKQPNTKLKSAVRYLLRQGMASPSEAARIAGVTRQLVNGWTRDIDWRTARERLLKRHLRTILP